MAITFPSSPSAGDIFTSNGKSWQYVNGKWEVYAEIVAPDVFAVDAVNDVVHVYGSMTAGASASIASDLVVDTNTLVVDSTNNRVGIGKTNPSVLLDLEHATQANIHVNDSGGTIGGDTNARLSFLAGGGLAGQVGFLDTTDGTMTVQNSVGDIAVEIASAGNVTFDLYDGNVGIGTTSPAVKLHVDSGSTAQFAAPQIYVAPSGHASSDRAAIQLDDIQLLTDIAGNGAEDFSIYSNTAGAHRLSIDSSGNVGVNDFSPSHKLDVNGSVAMNGTSQIFANWGSGSDIDGLLPGSSFGGVMYTNTSGHFAIGIRNNDTADSFSIVSGGGNSGGYTADNTFDLLVANFRGDGNGSIAGTWTTSASDERLKTVTGTITEPLTKISALEGFYFTWNDVASELGLPDADVVQVGVSAQSVLGVMPEAVRTAPISQGKSSETEYYTVMYERLVPLLIEGVKAQQTQIDALTAQNAALTTRIEALEAG